jgi:hypothetical protein
MKILIDTSFLLAVSAPKDVNHKLAVNRLLQLTGELLIPVVVLPELFYMCRVRVNYDNAVQFYQRLQTEDFTITPLEPSDRKRMSEIMAKYKSAQFDFVDCAIMALSERLNITRVATFDRRDFSIFRPAHCATLTLVPEN